MKKILIGVAILASTGVNAQLNLNKLKNSVKTQVETPTASKLTNDEVISGLKEALSVGVDNAGKSASVMDGFNKNDLIRIPFPAEAENMQKSLRKVGMGKQVDEFELVLNRAAEEAAKEAAPLFLLAIKSMSVKDGLSILKGEDNAATSYLEESTKDSLYTTFRPIVEKALQTVNITKYWSPLASGYNKIPLTKKVNLDLEDYTTEKAMEGLFKLLALEEKKIREEPAARVSDLLKKVFGA
ncbi:MAG: hypothetical protein ACI9U0_001698 [Flavobacteriales bacterium]|jgi:hypothetical protein|tara:strand:+ start:65 stop:787 length:723 start_codon:yes stop_codon:yes gene_type:complete